jgi:hypothetical protein
LHGPDSDAERQISFGLAAGREDHMRALLRRPDGKRTEQMGLAYAGFPFHHDNGRGRSQNGRIALLQSSYLFFTPNQRKSYSTSRIR